MFSEEAEGNEIQSTDEVLAFRSDLYFVKVKRQEQLRADAMSKGGIMKKLLGCSNILFLFWVQVLLVCLLQDIRLTEHSWSMALLYVAPL